MTGSRGTLECYRTEPSRQTRNSSSGTPSLLQRRVDEAAKLDAKLGASIAAGLNGVCSLFDDPKIREVFAPDPLWENFKGFDRLIEGGQIVALRVPKSPLKTVATTVGTMTKLNFFDSVLNRLARVEHGAGDVGRGVFFVADEYDGHTTQPGGRGLLLEVP